MRQEYKDYLREKKKNMADVRKQQRENYKALRQQHLEFETLYGKPVKVAAPLSGLFGLGAAAGARAPQNKKQCANAGGSWDASRRCCIGVSCAAQQAAQPGARIPVKNKKQCSAAGGLWTAKGKVCQAPSGTLGPGPVLDDQVPDGSMPTTKPWFMLPATKPGGLICPAIKKYCRSGTTYRPNPNACFGDCLDAQGNIVGKGNSSYSPPTKIPGEFACPTFPCPPCTVSLWDTDGCFKDCLDAKGNVIGQGTGPDVSQVACTESGPVTSNGFVTGEGITGGNGVATIRPEDLLTEFGGTGGAGAGAGQSQASWLDKLKDPKTLLILGAGAILLWGIKKNVGAKVYHRARGAVKRAVYSRRKAKKFRR
jgi:hypothetical protein